MNVSLFQPPTKYQPATQTSASHWLLWLSVFRSWRKGTPTKMECWTSMSLPNIFTPMRRSLRSCSEAWTGTKMVSSALPSRLTEHVLLSMLQSLTVWMVDLCRTDRCSRDPALSTRHWCEHQPQGRHQDFAKVCWQYFDSTCLKMLRVIFTSG